jgi:hypothetical protein
MKKRHDLSIAVKKGCFFLFGGLIAFSSLLSSQEMVDRILAVVNGDVITLTDIRIAEYYLFHEERAPGPSREKSLDRLIDQKLVVHMALLDISVTDIEIEENLQRIANRIGINRFQEGLDMIGMTREDLRIFLKEFLLFGKIISQRFEKVVFVSLDEIESYYNQTLVPESEALGQQIPSLLDAIEEIETAVKEQKIDKMAREWMRKLRQEADIKVFGE